MGRSLRLLTLCLALISCESASGPGLTIESLAGSWHQISCEAVAVADTTIRQDCSNGLEMLAVEATGAFALTIQVLPGEDPRPPITGQLVESGNHIRAVYTGPPVDTATVTYDQSAGTQAWTLPTVFRFESPVPLQDAAVTFIYGPLTR